MLIRVGKQTLLNRTRPVPTDKTTLLSNDIFLFSEVHICPSSIHGSLGSFSKQEGKTKILLETSERN